MLMRDLTFSCLHSVFGTNHTLASFLELVVVGKKKIPHILNHPPWRREGHLHFLASAKDHWLRFCFLCKGEIGRSLQGWEMVLLTVFIFGCFRNVLFLHVNVLTGKDGWCDATWWWQQLNQSRPLSLHNETWYLGFESKKNPKRNNRLIETHLHTLQEGVSLLVALAALSILHQH